MTFRYRFHQKMSMSVDSVNDEDFECRVEAQFERVLGAGVKPRADQVEVLKKWLFGPENVLFIGPTGCGKTTLLSVALDVAGLRDQGRLVVFEPLKAICRELAQSLRRAGLTVAVLANYDENHTAAGASYDNAALDDAVDVATAVAGSNDDDAVAPLDADVVIVVIEALTLSKSKANIAFRKYLESRALIDGRFLVCVDEADTMTTEYYRNELTHALPQLLRRIGLRQRMLFITSTLTDSGKARLEYCCNDASLCVIRRDIARGNIVFRMRERSNNQFRLNAAPLVDAIVNYKDGMLILVYSNSLDILCRLVEQLLNHADSRVREFMQRVNNPNDERGCYFYHSAMHERDKSDTNSAIENMVAFITFASPAASRGVNWTTLYQNSIAFQYGASNSCEIVQRSGRLNRGSQSSTTTATYYLIANQNDYSTHTAKCTTRITLLKSKSLAVLDEFDLRYAVEMQADALALGAHFRSNQSVDGCLRYTLLKPYRGVDDVPLPQNACECCRYDPKLILLGELDRRPALDNPTVKIVLDVLLACRLQLILDKHIHCVFGPEQVAPLFLLEQIARDTAANDGDVLLMLSGRLDVCNLPHIDDIGRMALKRLSVNEAMIARKEEAQTLELEQAKKIARTVDKANQKVVKITKQLQAPPCSCERNRKNAIIVLCSNESCTIKKYHKKCVVNDWMLENWLCSQCRPVDRADDGAHSQALPPSSSQFAHSQSSQLVSHRYGTRAQSTGGRGLRNLGNTCYMNAIFQALFAIDGFRDLVIRPARRASLCTALDALFSNLSTTFLTLSAADPAELRQVIIEHQRNHKSTVEILSYENGEQECASEFLMFLLSELSVELDIALNSALHKRLLALFGVQYRTMLTCVRCDLSTDNVGPMTASIVQLALNGGTLEKCYVAAGASSRTDDDYISTCCGLKGLTDESLTISVWPHVLLICLLRFQVTRKAYTCDEQMVALKNKATIRLPMQWTVTQNVTYRLLAVVHHIGESIACGHYTCDVFGNARRVNFDDERVQSTSFADEHIDSDTAYILFYERC